MYIGLYVKYPLFLSGFNKTWIFWTGFRKILKYHISCNISSRSRVVPCGWKGGRRDGQRDMTKLIVSFRSFANVT